MGIILVVLLLHVMQKGGGSPLRAEAPPKPCPKSVPLYGVLPTQS